MAFHFLQNAIDQIRVAIREPQITLDTPHGEVQWREISLPKNDNLFEEMREISDAELELLRVDASKAADFVQKYSSPDKFPSHPLDALDFAFAGWLQNHDQNIESAAEVIRILGSAYGFFCTAHLGFRWVWCKDRYGEDICLYRDKPQARSNIFSSIQYRIEDQKTDFIYAMYASLEHLISE